MTKLRILVARLSPHEGRGVRGIGEAWGDEQTTLAAALTVAARMDDPAIAVRVGGLAPGLLSAYRDAMVGVRESPHRAATTATTATTTAAGAAAGLPATPASAPRAAPDGVATRRLPLLPGRARVVPAWLPIRRAASLAGATLALAIVAGATAAAPPASPLYDVRIAWEELLLPGAPGARLSAEIVRLDRRVAEAEAAHVAGDVVAEAAAADAYVSIARGAFSIEPGDQQDRARLVERLSAEITLLERLRAMPGATSELGAALRAATMLEEHLRQELQPVAPAFTGEWPANAAGGPAGGAPGAPSPGARASAAASTVGSGQPSSNSTDSESGGGPQPTATGRPAATPASGGGVQGGSPGPTLRPDGSPSGSPSSGGGRGGPAVSPPASATGSPMAGPTGTSGGSGGGGQPNASPWPVARP